MTDTELLNRTQSLLSLLTITKPTHSDVIVLIKAEAEFLLDEFHEYRERVLHEI